MNTRTYNMLIAARLILDNSGPELTSASDAFTVARKVLAVQDAIELALNALSITTGRAKKTSENLSFPDLVAYVVDEFSKQEDESTRSRFRASFTNLNHARVRFKHHGDLQDPITTFPLIGEALETLDTLCSNAINSPLRDIDAISALTHSAVAQLFREAERLITEDLYQQALIAVARALTTAFWDFGIAGITVGKDESEGALVLSGRGIDPASFLSMQRILPNLYSPFDDQPKFDTRRFGHEANWTKENARFCLDTALTVVSRLQHARPIPEAVDFYNEFEDVLAVTHPGVKYFRIKGLWGLNNGLIPGTTIEASPDQVFSGKAEGFWDMPGTSGLPELPMPLSDARWIRLRHHNLTETGATLYLGMDEIWLNAADVTVTYRDSPLTRARKAYLAGLTTGEAELDGETPYD